MLTYVFSIGLLALLCALFMGIQILAKKMNIRNHIESGGCCGACSNKECSKAVE